MYFRHELRYSGNSLSLGPGGVSSKHRLQLTLEEDVSSHLLLFSHAQIMWVRKPGNILHCQTSGDTICPC